MRIKSEFDKAEEIYEKILLKDSKQAEAYWGVLLCKYGIEYVEDPNTYKRIPTCHRTSFDAIIADEYYKLAIENADSRQKEIYEEEAKYIDKVQKEILAISQKEEPYDIFICYKETDNGKRTQDSVIANDIYYQLTNEGYKVFYAAISLEDKLGSAYEPVIFAALNSSKVMLVIGTKPEYFNAVWVKNEWSRYLKIMQKDRSKILIPCYKEMDAYELPEEFAHLQAQDMSKVGFINDIVRGIKKVVGKNKETTSVNNNVQNSTTSNYSPLLKRAYMFAEDGDFENAEIYAEKVLDIEPECADGYAIKLMCQYKAKLLEDLGKLKHKFDNNLNYNKTIKFANKELKEKFDNIIKSIENNIEIERKAKEEKRKLEEERRRAEEERKILEKEKKKQELLPLVKRLEHYSKMISIGSHNLVALKSDGTVIAIGNNRYGQCNVSDWRNIVAVATNGYQTTVGLKSDGTVVLVGNINYDVSKWKNIVAISMGILHIVGLKSDGTVVAVGNNDDGQCNVSDWKDIVSISTGNYHTVGLKSDGTVVAVGKNINKQCNVSEWKDIVAISAGWYTTLGLKSDKSVVSTEFAIQHSWQDIKDVIGMHAGYLLSIGLKQDGSLVLAASDISKAHSILIWQDIVAVQSTYDSIVVGLKADGTLVTTDNKRFKISKWKLFETEEERNIRKKELEKEKEQLQIELRNVKGLFATSKKKSIEAKLEEIENKLAKLK